MEEKIELDEEISCPCGKKSMFILMNHETGAWHCDKCDGSITGTTVSRDWENV